MSEKKPTVNIRVFGNEYYVSCEDDEVDDLLASAREVNRRMEQIRGGTNTLGLERLAVMAALNLSHDNLRLRRRLDGAAHDAQDRVKALSSRVAQVIEDAPRVAADHALPPE